MPKTEGRCIDYEKVFQRLDFRRQVGQGESSDTVALEKIAQGVRQASQTVKGTIPQPNGFASAKKALSSGGSGCPTRSENKDGRILQPHSQVLMNSFLQAISIGIASRPTVLIPNKGIDGAHCEGFLIHRLQKRQDFHFVRNRQVNSAIAQFGKRWKGIAKLTRGNFNLVVPPTLESLVLGT